MEQLNLFNVVEGIYKSVETPISNGELYQRVIQETNLTPEDLNNKVAIGRTGAMHSTLKRKIRWYQQTLKSIGLIKRVEGGQKGLWQLSEPQGKDLKKAKPGVKLVAFSTSLGVCIWGSNTDTFTNLDEPIALCISSPPYPLRTARKYGNPTLAQYIEFILRSLEPVIKGLMPGGSLVLNVGNDIFESGSPARTMYVEELMLSIKKEFGLELMDRIPWVNYSKPPTPTQWACVERVQLKSSYEHIYWFTNDPMRVRSDNRRVLVSHTETHQRLIAAGGEKRITSYGDNAHRLRVGSFSGETSGSIARNVFEKGHICPDTKFLHQTAKELGLPRHGAMFPTALPEFFIQFLTEPGDLVVDLFSGAGKVAVAAERLKRRWLVSEIILEFTRLSAELFRSFEGFQLFPAVR